MSGLYNVITFDENDKWVVIYEGKVNEKYYSYLAKLNDSEDGIKDEYKLFEIEYSLGDEYMDEVTDKEEYKKVITELMPEVKNLIENPGKLNKAS